MPSENEARPLFAQYLRKTSTNASELSFFFTHVEFGLRKGELSDDNVDNILVTLTRCSFRRVSS